MEIASTPSQRSRGVWLIPVGLILLTLIPIASGSLRLTQLGGGPELIPAAARFTESPVPVRWMARRHSARLVPGLTVTGLRRLRTRSRSSVMDGTRRATAASLSSVTRKV